MMNAKLGVITCDKCGKPMKKDERTIIITEGRIVKSKSELDFEGTAVR